MDNIIGIAYRKVVVVVVVVNFLEKGSFELLGLTETKMKGSCGVQ